MDKIFESLKWKSKQIHIFGLCLVSVEFTRHEIGLFSMFLEYLNTCFMNHKEINLIIFSFREIFTPIFQIGQWTWPGNNPHCIVVANNQTDRHIVINMHQVCTDIEVDFQFNPTSDATGLYITLVQKKKNMLCTLECQIHI